MENKQTAVEWLEEQFRWMLEDGVDISDVFHSTIEKFKQAKQMEKEQIKDAFTDGCIGEMYELNAYYTSEKYYNKTYKQQEK
jgi:hypothetical protein